MNVISVNISNYNTEKATLMMHWVSALSCPPFLLPFDPPFKKKKKKNLRDRHFCCLLTPRSPCLCACYCFAAPAKEIHSQKLSQLSVVLNMTKMIKIMKVKVLTSRLSLSLSESLLRKATLAAAPCHEIKN